MKLNLHSGKSIPEINKNYIVKNHLEKSRLWGAKINNLDELFVNGDIFGFRSEINRMILSVVNFNNVSLSVRFSSYLIEYKNKYMTLHYIYLKAEKKYDEAIKFCEKMIKDNSCRREKYIWEQRVLEINDFQNNIFAK